MIKPRSIVELENLRIQEKKYEKTLLTSMIMMIVILFGSVITAQYYGAAIFKIMTPILLFFMGCMCYWGHRLKHIMYEFKEGEWNLPNNWHLDPVLHAYFWGVKDVGREKPSLADELRIESYLKQCE